jgi:hypothetical protein
MGENASMSDTITTKDIKILWGRAGGKCSVCKIELTQETIGNETKTTGEMAHIVGEKVTSPRGTSPLTSEQRNSYHNLILLCRNHHAEIDNDILKYPVEILHQFKSEHELWEKEKSGNKIDPDPDDLVYADLIDNITKFMMLDKWFGFTLNATSDLLNCDFLISRTQCTALHMKTIWPDKYPELAQSIKDVIEAFINYVKHFETNAALDHKGNYLQADKSYKSKICDSEYYDLCAKKVNEWSMKNYYLLCIYTNKLNNYANAVRKYINPLYFRTEGNFLIYYDDGLRSIITLPDDDYIKNRFQK